MFCYGDQDVSIPKIVCQFSDCCVFCFLPAPDGPDLWLSMELQVVLDDRNHVFGGTSWSPNRHFSMGFPNNGYRVLSKETEAPNICFFKSVPMGRYDRTVFNPIFSDTRASAIAASRCLICTFL